MHFGGKYVSNIYVAECIVLSQTIKETEIEYNIGTIPMLPVN